jgi:hypothetical protein
MLAGIPVAADSVAELAHIVRAAGADEVADRLERALQRLSPSVLRRLVVLPHREQRVPRVVTCRNDSTE